MKKISAYSSRKEAIASLDNGGRFYNVLTKADDGIITKAELGKVAGVFNDKQQMILFLELSTINMSESDKELVLNTLDEGLMSVYEEHFADELLASEANERGVLSTNVIISGIPTLVESSSDFNGFIMVPIMAGKVMTFAMIPIVDQYDVYEVRDDATSDSILIAHAKRSEKLPEKKLKIAGVLKELKSKKDKEKADKKFLEAVYYLEDE